MKYMGSKRELLERIDDITRPNLDPGKVFLDLFAGTCGVGIYLRDQFPIYSNDIQTYSEVISNGTIRISPIQYTRSEILALIQPSIQKNYDALASHLTFEIKDSQCYRAIKGWSPTNLDQYIKFMQSLAPNATMVGHDNWLRDEYAKRSIQPALFPYLQTTYLFAEMYFGIEQAMMIDSVKYAIDNLSSKHANLAKVLNAALIHAFSYTSAGTGHFAQFRDLATLSSVEDVFKYRSKSVMDYLLRKAEEIISVSHVNSFPEQSDAFSRNYLDVLNDSEIMKNVGMVYADPPYSFVHYSRFYHAIENLCRYDYPEVEHKGRYRKDRHQSPFCIKTKASEAFRNMFKSIRPYGIPCLVSYSNTGMIELNEVVNVAQEEGFNTVLAEAAHKHSTMGRLKDKDRHVSEALLLCK